MGLLIVTKSSSLHNCYEQSGFLLNTRPAGAGAAPLPDFLDGSKKANDIDAKLSVPSPASI